MLTLFLTEAAVGSLLVLLAVPPRAAGRGFFRYAVAQSGVLLLLALALSYVAGRAAAASTAPFVVSAFALLVAAGLFHGGHLMAGLAAMILGLVPGLAGVIADALALAPAAQRSPAMLALFTLDALTAGLVTGAVLIAMILGHFYLNIPGLSIEHLQRLALIALFAIVARAVVLAVGVSLHSASLGPLVDLLLDTGPQPLPTGGLDPFVLVLLILQVAFGLLAPGVFAFMAWRSARISSTQSATGILYVTLVMVIMGELAGRYLITLTHLPI